VKTASAAAKTTASAASAKKLPLKSASAASAKKLPLKRLLKLSLPKLSLKLNQPNISKAGIV
jgi:hypothetical protein